MGDIKGFLKVKRIKAKYRAVCERLGDFKDVVLLRTDVVSQEQASRCMDCGTPFCHWGCPVGNYIPEWNDAMFRGQWEKAAKLLQGINNLPEITGRICPAICEYACVLGINDDAVTVRENELAIIEHAFKEGLVKPDPPHKRSGKKVAIIGSGPAGLACADQLNKAGHEVMVFERDDKIGGILRYGIPDFKLDKSLLDRRINILIKEGVKFSAATQVPEDYSVKKLKNEFNAICLAMGSRQPRDLKIEGREAKGIHFAMEYLIQSNKLASGQTIPLEQRIHAQGKKVVIIGGGDTGADCVGVAHRQKASCVVQIELLSQPPECRTANMPWPAYPLLLKNSSSHEEGGERVWSVLTKRFLVENGSVKKLLCVRVKHTLDSERCPVTEEVAGSEFEIEADLVILALGFIHVEHNSAFNELGIQFDKRGNILTNHSYMTSAKGIFSAGDARRGQSLVVWAIAEGRRCAYDIDKYLMGESGLPEL